MNVTGLRLDLAKNIFIVHIVNSYETYRNLDLEIKK